MAYEFRDIASVEIVESPSETATVLIEDDGVIKRIPKEEVGSGTVKSVNGASPDETGNVTLSVAASWNDLEDRPFYAEEIPKVIVKGGNGTSIDTSFDSNNVIVYIYDHYDNLLEEHECTLYSDRGKWSEYEVTLYGNGELAYNNNGSVTCDGNDIREWNTDLPFAVFWCSNNGGCIAIDESKLTQTDSYGVYEVKVVSTTDFENVYTPIPEEYIPETIARKTDVSDYVMRGRLEGSNEESKDTINGVIFSDYYDTIMEVINNGGNVIMNAEYQITGSSNYGSTIVLHVTSYDSSRVNFCAYVRNTGYITVSFKSDWTWEAYVD